MDNYDRSLTAIGRIEGCMDALEKLNERPPELQFDR